MVVTAVDVLTCSLGAEVPKEHTEAAGTPVPEALRRTMTRTGSMMETPESRQRKIDKAKKLEGLVGIYSGHNDRRANWWGILPIHTPDPCAVQPPEAAPAERGTVPQVTPHSTNSGVSSVGGSVHPVTTPHLDKLPFGAVFERPTGPRPVAESHQAAACFVNAGTHQIPLFEGTPPEELISSPDPMQWLTDRLRAQHTFERRLAQQDSIMSRFSLCGSPATVHDVVDSGDSRGSNASINTNPNASSRRRSSRRANNEAYLTAGCSVMVRLVDSRLRQLDGPPLVRDIAKPVSEKLLKTVLRAAATYNSESDTAATHVKTHILDKSKYSALCKRFNFIALKDVETRTVRSAIPPNVDPEVLVEEVNLKFSQSMFN